MKKIKIFVDIIMFITLVILMMLYVFSVQVHEIAGLAIIVEFIIHEFLNYKEIKIMWQQFIEGKANKKVKNIVIIDIILTFLMVVSCLSGLLISKYVIRLNVSNNEFWYIVHIISIYITVFIILYHILKHTKSLVIGIGNLIGIKYRPKKDYFLYSILVGCTLIIPGLFIKNGTLNKIKNIYHTVQEKATIIDNKEKIDSSVQPTKQQIYNYLSDFFCNGCSRHCLLSAPQCIVGEKKAEITKIEYIEQYNQANNN